MSQVVSAIELLFLFAFLGKLLGYREQVKRIEFDMLELDLDSQWRRVIGRIKENEK